MAYRQFVRKDSKDIVLCEWDARRGAWRCSSTPGSPYNQRVDTLSKLVPGMQADGFEEITPRLRKPARFSKSKGDYVPLKHMQANPQEVVLQLPTTEKSFPKSD